MYHPDKVEGLAPEYRQIADQKMKVINAAYEQLKLTPSMNREEEK
jgi:curved DNA-binding protein CbpA